jgi:hypothetical protein
VLVPYRYLSIILFRLRRRAVLIEKILEVKTALQSRFRGNIEGYLKTGRVTGIRG